VKVAKVIGQFWRLQPPRRIILLEAAGRLLLAQVSIHTIPFRWLTGGLGVARAESPEMLRSEDELHVRQVAWAIHAIVRHLPRRPKCLVQGVAAQWMLRRRRIASTLYLGVARDLSSNLSAHAWVRCGNVYVTGGNERHGFTTISHFATQFTP
jgi:hypothetical protein